MDTFLFLPAGEPHHVIAIGGEPSTLKQLGFDPAGVGDKVYVLQPTGGDLRYTINPGAGPVVGQRGLVLKDCRCAVFHRDEVVSSQWVSDSGHPVNLQIYTAIDRAMR